MAFEARRFTGEPLKQPTYNFRDVPYCTKDLTGSTLSIVTDRKHLVDSIAEMTLLCNEAARRQRLDPALSTKYSEYAPPPASTKGTTKPLSIEYIFDRIDTDDPQWGLMVRTDAPTSLRGRGSNTKASPMWRRGMLQGFITYTTFTNWQSTFRFDSLHQIAFAQDNDELEYQMKNGLRRYDGDGSLAEGLEATVKGGNPHFEGIVYPRVAEVSLFGGLGCGKVRRRISGDCIARKCCLMCIHQHLSHDYNSHRYHHRSQQLLKLLIEHLECMKATARQNYDYIILQATENSIPFYESMGFIRVGCVQGKIPSPNEYVSNPVFEYYTKKNGETPSTIANEYGVDPWDIVFLNRPLHGDELIQKSWLKLGTKIFVPKLPAANAKKSGETMPVAPKWYVAEENETPRTIAKKFSVDFSELLNANRRRYPDLVGHSKLLEGTRVQISCFHVDEGSDSMAYSHWCFPDGDDAEDNEASYMMAMKLNKRKGNDAKERPVADALAVPIKQYEPVSCGVGELLLSPPKAKTPLAPVFAKKPQTTSDEPKKPRRPLTSYMFFTATMAAKYKGTPFNDLIKLLSDKWRAMTDVDKIPYQDKYEESKAEYVKAMQKYEKEMKQYRRLGSGADVASDSNKDEFDLLEKVVKLKSTDGIVGANKFEYYYVLTFIRDLHWVHLSPMRKAGVFAPDAGKYASGRPIWCIVGEDEGKEIDTTASLCVPATAIAMRESENADEEQWDIYDNGEIPPPMKSEKKVKVKSGGSCDEAPVRPKKPATSFALFCADAKHVMRGVQLENMPMSERTKLIAEKWKAMSESQKQKYKDQHAVAQGQYAKKLQRYKLAMAKFERLHPKVVVDESTKTPKSQKKKTIIKHSTPASKYSLTKMTLSGESKRPRGRPRKNDDTVDATSKMRKTVKITMGGMQVGSPIVVVTSKTKKTVKITSGMKFGSPLLFKNGTTTSSSNPGPNDIVLSFLNDKYKVSDWRKCIDIFYF